MLICDGDYTLRCYPYQLHCKDKDNFGNHQIFCVKKSQQYISWYKKIGEELKSPPIERIHYLRLSSPTFIKTLSNNVFNCIA